MTETNRPSSFLATKGLFPDQTYRAFLHWDLQASAEDNVRELRRQNTVGGPSIGWLKDFGKILLRRFGETGPPEALVDLAKAGCEMTVWRPLLLWHCCERDALLEAFLSDWLFSEHERGAVKVSRDAAESFVRDFVTRAGYGAWSDSNITQSSSGLLRTAVAFGLLTNGRQRHFSDYVMPNESMLYVLHYLFRQEQSSVKVIGSSRWRIFMMSSAHVEGELLRLHQLHRVEFHRAGSLVELKLPFASESAFARSLS